MIINKMAGQKLRILILFVSAIFLLHVTAEAQVVVEKSKDKVVISGKPYYIHIVKKGETSYSISKAYGLKVDDLVSENPSASNGIKEGQSLRIPVVSTVTEPKPSTEVQRDETKFIYHKLSTGDTVFSLAKKYGVSEEEILQSNPGVEINKLSVGSEIAIPRRQFTTTPQNLEVSEKEYINYKVSKGESITSIAQKFGITVKEIRKENRGVIFPRVDDYLRIPVQKMADEVKKEEVKKDTLIAEIEEPAEKSEKPAGYTVVGSLKGKYNVALLLPLYFEENSQRTELDTSQVVKGKPVKRIIQRPDQWIYPESMTFLELYQGILIAADTLRSIGLDINISVFDIKRDTVDVTALIKSGKLDEMDLIIGPVYSHNLGIIADYASSREIPVVSPVPLRSNNTIINRPYLFMAFPSLGIAQMVISKRVSEYYNGNFVFIHSDTARIDPAIDEFKNMIFKELSAKIPYEEIKFKELLFYNRSAIGNDSINRLEHALSEKTDNIILIASEESSVLSETIMDLHTLSKKYPVRVIGYPAMRDIDNLEPKYYFELGIELYSPYWIDYTCGDVKKFIRSYRNKFLTEPSESSFSWQGYDITYYFLSGLAIHGKKFLRNPEIHNPDLLESDYDFSRNTDESGFENRKLFHIRYNGEMEVKMMEDNKITSNGNH
jgi:LysM repeat protein